jgi:hypothetical protein
VGQKPLPYPKAQLKFVHLSATTQKFFFKDLKKKVIYLI